MTPVEKAAAYVVEIARMEVGYREKASNSQLDDKTANAGSSNYTKYAAYFDRLWNSGVRWYNTRKQGGEWCDMFFDWAQCQAWGYEIARKVVYQPMESCGAGCEFSARYYKDNSAWTSRNGTPEIGDQIFFGPVGKETHTGMVVGVDANNVYTIEGNSGNRCAERAYIRSASNIAGYGRPNYGLVAHLFEDTKEEDMTKAEIEALLKKEREETNNAIAKAIDDAMGPVIHDYTEIPWKSVRDEVEEMVRLGVIDGGTSAEVNPNDVNMRLQDIRVLTVAKRFTVKTIAERFKKLTQALFKKDVE